MMDKIFEMMMKEARSRPGDDLYVKVQDVIFELNVRILKSFGYEPSIKIPRLRMGIKKP